MSFNDFVHKYDLKNKTTSNIKVYEVLKKIGLNSEVGIFLGDGNISTNYGIVNLQPNRGTHWVVYIKENIFDSYGCSPPQSYLNLILNEMDIVHILNIKFEK